MRSPETHVLSPPNRLLRIAVVMAMVVTMLAGVAPRAEAHAGCLPQMTSNSLVQSLVSAVNVFSSIFSTSEEDNCVDKFADVEPVMERDYVPDSVKPAARGAAGASSGQPQSYAECTDGMAADTFSCRNIDMLGHVTMEELDSVFVNDMWGWTDPETGIDFALVGSSEGTTFIDISDPMNPVVYGRMPTASTQGGASWRDIKVYENHAFVVSEHTDHGVQVFDLTRLRNWDGEYTIYDMDAHYLGHGSSHNININEETGYLYSVGSAPHSSQPKPFIVTIDEGSAAGTYQATGASFGGALDEAGLDGDVVLVDDGSALPTEGCGTLVDFPAGAIALADRGSCAFAQKAANAQAAGASALIVANTQGAPINMGGDDPSVTIPSVMISTDDGTTIKAGLPATGGVAANPAAQDLCGSGLHMIDINDPVNPTYAGCFDDHGYVHDTQCVVYDGPDADYQDRELCFNSTPDGEESVSIVDVTDKANPVAIVNESYGVNAYSHQGWLSEDQSTFFHGDELDESGGDVDVTTTRVWDMNDLDTPVLAETFANDTTSIDHNMYTEGDRMYQSNYTSGLRVMDISNAATDGLREVAYFDVYPENDNASFEGGTWSNYAYFSQPDIVGVSSIDRGFFILRVDPDAGREGEQRITATVPDDTPGEFLWSIDGDGQVDLGEMADQGTYLQATGPIDPIVVSDTRDDGPTWSISGQVSDFTPGDLGGEHLGWTPEVIEPGAGATAGDPVPSGIDGGDGLSTAQTLASAEPGHELGTSMVGAELDLRFPAETDPGEYTATLTVTALS